MKPKSRPGVALLVKASRAYGRELLRGVALFARTQANWSLLHQEMTLDSWMPDWMMSSTISGVIARIDTHTVDPLRKLNGPIVDVLCNRKFPGIPQVETDNQRVAELAFHTFGIADFDDSRFVAFSSLPIPTRDSASFANG